LDRKAQEAVSAEGLTSILAKANGDFPTLPQWIRNSGMAKFISEPGGQGVTVKFIASRGREIMTFFAGGARYGPRW
jgi:hypothetical protein